MHRLCFHRQTGVSRGFRETNEGNHEPTRCYFVVSLSPMRHVTLCCTGIGLWEVMKITGHRFVTKAALEDPKDPSRGHEDGRAATCDGA